jgi:hypothetical protein
VTTPTRRPTEPHYESTRQDTCAVCGCSCVGRTNSARGKKYPYYRCSDDHTLRLNRAPRGHAPYVRAEWLEETVWADPEYGRHSPVHGTLRSWVVQALPSGNSNSLSDSRFISEE